MPPPTTYHLRPVSDTRSASPSTSTSTASDSRSPPPGASKPIPGLLPPHSASANRPRRPLSPSSLRDVDLSSRDHDMPMRKYPAPPTGHELMALFPPAPPINIRGGPTSGFFQREERAFFAQAGKEIVRVRIEVDMPHNGESPVEESKPRPQSWHPHPSTVNPSPSQSSPGSRNLPPVPFPHTQAHTTHGRTASRGGPVPLTAQPASFAAPSHGTAQPPMPPSHHPSYPVRSPTHEHPRLSAAMAGPGNQMPAEPMMEEYRDDPDESWRRPMPHNQRRRAGKHTKRVVVK